MLRQSGMKIFIRCSIVMLIATLTGMAMAHTDMIAPLTRVEKVYQAPKPLGEMKVIYTAGRDAVAADEERGIAAEAAVKPGLTIACDLFESSVPGELLEDLPRPDWNGLYAAFSLTNFSRTRGEWVDEPYVYITVRLHGPVGESWEQTWATFHFDHNGQLERRIKRFVPVPNPRIKSTLVIWEAWPAGTEAEDILKARMPE